MTSYIKRLWNYLSFHENDIVSTAPLCAIETLMDSEITTSCVIPEPAIVSLYSFFEKKQEARKNTQERMIIKGRN